MKFLQKGFFFGFEVREGISSPTVFYQARDSKLEQPSHCVEILCYGKSGGKDAILLPL